MPKEKPKTEIEKEKYELAEEWIKHQVYLKINSLKKFRRDRKRTKCPKTECGKWQYRITEE